MKEIVIKIPDETLNVLMEHDWSDKKIVTEEALKTLENAFFDGKVLPKGHGRLIDADKLKPYGCDYDNGYGCDKICHCDNCSHQNVKASNIDKAPTIVEADKEEE